MKRPTSAWLCVLGILLTAAPAAAWELEGLRLRGRLIGAYELRDEEGKIGRWTDTFSLRNARLDGRWEVVEDLRLVLEVELADGLALRDAYARYQVHKAFRLTLGSFKKPFSRLRLDSPWELLIPRRGLLDGEVISDGPYGGFGGRDIGLMASGSVGKEVKFKYFAGVFDGRTLVPGFYRDADDPDAPNASHRDYVARLQLRPLKGLILAADYCYKRAGILLAPGQELEHWFNLVGFDLRWSLAGFRLQLEGAWGDNPNAVKGRRLLGGHATASYRIRFGELLVLTPAFMAEILDPDDGVGGGRAVRLAGALTLGVGPHAAVVLSAEGGLGELAYEEPEYFTPGQLEPKRVTRAVPTRVLLHVRLSL
ncbi:MAG TPA: porin [Myxococcota bacterium]|nr:porin [Myxococcota bacterium]HRY92870.1 porin [Myxococcota bacterium]HSA20762.1 porin [Myxococcota bacterium]